MGLFERSAGKGSGDTVDETIEGTLERIVFSDASGEFTVVRLKTDKEAEPVTAVGTLLGLPVGARLRTTGHYENNPRFGRQFRIVSYTELSQQTLEGIKRYLGAGLIKGIGPELAARIVARFGERTLEILDAQPYRIRQVPGIGQSRASAIQKAWSSQRGQREVMVFLQGYGVSPALAARIYKRYGAEAIHRVRENPYRLAFDVWGIGFLSADRLAGALGIGKESDVRVQAGVRHVLEEAGGQGHVYLPRDKLAQDAVARLGVAVELVEPAIDRLARDGEIAIEHSDRDVAVYDTGLLRAERAAADGLRRLLRTPGKPLPLDSESAITAYEKEAGITLAPRQAEAIRRALHEPVLVITGGPGVGKTTIVRGIVSLFLACKRSVALAAPTGRAAKRLQETTGQPAATLHRLLEWRPREGMFGRNQSRPLETDLLVVDEASMIDIRLCADLVAALSSGTRLLLVGDQDQLPSVGPGMVLRDVIASGTFPVVRLNEIFRQAAQSLIVTNAHRIHDGEIPELGGRVSADGLGPAALDRGGSKGPAQGPLPSRVSADGLGPAALDRGGSKGPAQGPLPSRVSADGLGPAALDRGGSKGPAQGPLPSRVSADGLGPAALDRGGSKGPAQGPLPSRVSADGLGPAALDRGGSKGPAQGPLPSDSKAGRDFFFLEADDPELAAATVRDLVATRLPRYYGFSPFDIQVLTPMHKGALGATNINHLLQEALTPMGEALQSGGRLFRTGDRIMQLRNNYDKDVFNGDVGRVVRVARDAGELVASFDDREVIYESDELDELTLAYAATVHKSQGSEYAAVVIPIHTQHFVMLARSLLYTAVTRGKKLVVLVGSRKALALAVKNAEVAKRYSRLQLRLTC